MIMYYVDVLCLCPCIRPSLVVQRKRIKGEKSTNTNHHLSYARSTSDVYGLTVTIAISVPQVCAMRCSATKPCRAILGLKQVKKAKPLYARLKN
jgi:hypothetical protein